MLGTFTGFEAFCLAWYFDNISPFAMDSGLVGELVRELELPGLTKSIFLRAVSLIYIDQLKVRNAKAQMESENA
jgi:hypothetical protein